MSNFSATQYLLCNVSNGHTFEDLGWTLDDPNGGTPSLIRAIYKEKKFNPVGIEKGIYRFADWLPISRTLSGSCAPVTYRSDALSKLLGIENLYVTFNGYYPKVGAMMTTCSFKETEAYSVCGRLGEAQKGRILVVASAGNTARAFAKVCSQNNIPLLLSVPEDNINALWFEEPLNDCVKLISPQKGGDYYDAINLGNVVLGCDKFFAEGGAKNVARRDGMATTVLSAVDHIGRIPDYYFQAVGSGTGAIAAWEANLRLIEDGRFGTHKMRLMVSQNAPFIPMYDAWKAHSRDMLHYDEDQARHDVEEIDAKVLSNRKPPYSIAGGLFDALVDSDGDILIATNEEARAAAELFLSTEGVDIHPAAATALASLIKATKDGSIDTTKTVMLNITGGGENHMQKGKKIHYLTPSLIFPLNADPKDVISKVEKLF